MRKHDINYIYIPFSFDRIPNGGMLRQRRFHADRTTTGVLRFRILVPGIRAYSLVREPNGRYIFKRVIHCDTTSKKRWETSNAHRLRGHLNINIIIRMYKIYV
jgi:hypothetical protein